MYQMCACVSRILTQDLVNASQFPEAGHPLISLQAKLVDAVSEPAVESLFEVPWLSSVEDLGSKLCEARNVVGDLKSQLQEAEQIVELYQQLQQNLVDSGAHTAIAEHCPADF